MTHAPKDAPAEPDFERIAINMLRPVRGCATDQQFQDAVANVTAALRECAAGRTAAALCLNIAHHIQMGRENERG